MELLASQVAELQKTIASLASLPSIVARLSSQLEAQTSTIASLSSTVARLSSENESKDIVLRQLEAKVFPQGFWVYEKSEEGGRDGVWKWSGSQDRYHPPQSLVKTGPPTSFATLPVELLRIVFFSSARTERARLTRLSFRLLEVFGPLLYAEVLLRRPDPAIAFVRARLSVPNPAVSRVTPLLAVSQLTLDYQQPEYPEEEEEQQDFDSEDEDELVDALARKPLPPSQFPIIIPCLKIQSLSTPLPFEFAVWSPILSLLQPINLILSTTISSVPTSPSFAKDFVPDESMLFRKDWNQLRSVASLGRRSIFVFPEGTEGRERNTSIWEESFDAEVRRAGLDYWAKMEYFSGKVEEELIVDLQDTFRKFRNLSFFFPSRPVPGDVIAVRVELRKKDSGVEEGGNL